MPVTGDNIDKIMANLADLRAKREQANKLMDELEASVINECGKHLEDPRTRRVFMDAKVKELDKLGVQIKVRSAEACGYRLFSRETGRRVAYRDAEMIAEQYMLAWHIDQRQQQVETGDHGS
jgi:hypothetical protein